MKADDVGEYKEVASTINTYKIDTVEVLQSSEAGDKPLLPESRYFFKAVAVNLIQICISVTTSLQLANETEVWTIAASVPDSPPSPYFLNATGGMITISMMTPANMQGALCTGFSISVDDGNGTSFKNVIESTDDVIYEIAFLQASSSYMISVAIVTNLGTSLYSLPTTMNTTAPTTPLAPRGIAVVNITGSSAIITWSSPRDSGGIDITGYTMILLSLGSPEERPAVSSPFLLRDLVANTLYTVKVVAINALGKKSSRSMGATFKTLSPTLPSEPSGISSVFSSGGAIEVTWNPPNDRGGELLRTMGYMIVIYSAAPCFDNDAANVCSTCNAVKLSSDRHELINSGSVCERPTTECLDGTLNCCLTREDSKYGLGYTCERMKTLNTPRSVVGTTSAVFNGLNYSTIYHFGVQAINSAGKSAISHLQGLQTTWDHISAIYWYFVS
ncbi:hypothetical protein PHMEG_00017171 [Phytophthora megakarya]|uniref:Fibronectin type-III domain-containing protein n=1 Tax=Phytophthora megakarya TaxID=4795 RepID=A0A225VZJ9_9STRA|nr:hypothetical protein PHMEG_00017171 [Phytophthora megakarya]